MSSRVNREKVLDNLAAVPALTDEVVPSVAVLEQLYAVESTRLDVALNLATLYLSEGRVEEAITLLQKIVAQEDSAAGRCNLGAAYLLEDKLSEAIVELSKAVLLDSALVAAHLHLAQAQALSGDNKAATQALERVVAYQPKNTTALCDLADLLLAQGGQDEQEYLRRADALYHQALRSDADCARAQIALGRVLAKKGYEQFLADEIAQACATWGESYRDYPSAFTGDAQALRYLKEAAASVRRRKLLAVVKQKIVDAAESERADLFYQYTQLFLLQEQLLPECFEPLENLEQRKDYWQGQTSTEQVFPYAHYRLGIVYGLQGLFQEAADEVLYARDYLPSSKHSSLSVDALAAFFRAARELVDEDDALAHDTSSAQSWEEAGFEDPFSQQAWRQTGCTPSEAAQWRDLELRAQEVSEWKMQAIDVSTAEVWIAADMKQPTVVVRWLRAGVPVSQAVEWNEHFAEDITLAIQCIQLGFSNPQEAKQWLDVFLFPYEAIAWKQSGFSAEEAKKWRKSGVKDPFDAKQQRDVDEAIFAAAQKEQEAQKEKEGGEESDGADDTIH